MPIRMEQIGDFQLSDFQIAMNAAIEQSKIANQIADPTGWISKGTVNVIDSFTDELASGYQEFGLNTTGVSDSELRADVKYNIEINATNYVIDTVGQATPISFDTVVSLIDVQIDADGLTANFITGDIRITNDLQGYDKNVFINPNSKRHRLVDSLLGNSLEDSISGTGITWDDSGILNGRIFFATDVNETRIGVSTSPYYSAIGGQGGETKVTVVDGNAAQDWTGTTGTIFRSDTGFAADASNVFVYFNGSLLEYGELGTVDYQVAVGSGIGGEYTDVVLNASFNTEAEDKVTIIVYDSAELSVYATKAYVDNKLTGSVELTGNTTVGGNLTPDEASLYDVGSIAYPWNNLILNDSLEFAPIGTGDISRIYRSVVGEDTQMKFQIGTSVNDKMIFEDETNAALLVIDGDGGVTIPGDLTVQGTTNYANEENTTITDADFIIKQGSGDGDATFSVERTTNNTSLKWNDSIDRWQVVYGSTANITSNILTEHDLTAGLDLDGRYFTSSKLVVAGDVETEGAIKYAGIQDVTAPNGVFYSGGIKPDDHTRLNYGGDLYVSSLYADDVYVSANSLYINGKKVIEDVADVMTFRGDIDQTITLKTLGDGDVYIQSEDELVVQTDGDIGITLAATLTNKNISITNNSANGMIKFNDFIQTSAIDFSQTNADGFATEFGYDQQTLFNWSVRDIGTTAPSSIMGAVNVNRQDLHEYVELVAAQGAGIGIAAGANLIGVDGITGITPVNGTLGSDGNLQEMLEGLTTNSFVSDVPGNKIFDNINDITITSNTTLNLMAGDEFNIYGESESYINVQDANLLISTIGSSTPGSVIFDSVGAVEFTAATNIAFTASESSFTGTVEIGASGKLEGGQAAPSGTDILGYNGYFYATRVYNAVYNDLAEFMPGVGEVGQVLVQTADGVKPANKRGNGSVVGVYSDSYGYALGGDEESEGKVPVGLSGRVWVWVEEPCSFGDLLITSDKIGFGSVKQSAEDGLGKVFAKVMEEKTDFTPQRVEVLILMA